MRHRFSVLALIVVSACAPNVEESADTLAAPTPAIPVTPPDSATMRAASKALASFLEASREGSRTRDSLAALTACGEAGSVPPGPMLARFTVLAPSARGDTVVGRAVVTTVAEQDVDRQHPGYFIARVRVRSDTLEWDVMPSASSGWVVCNGLRFGITAPDSLTSWRPNGATAATARALADSIAARN